MMRTTHYCWFFPATLLDTGFDDDQGAYLDRIKGEIDATGVFKSGIDVEPNFSNGVLPGAYLNNQIERETEAGRQQSAWEADRAARRKEQDEAASREWAEIDRRNNWAQSRELLIESACMFLQGLSWEDIGGKFGMLPHEFIRKTIAAFVAEITIPEDADWQFEFDIRIALTNDEELRKYTRLAKSLDWGA